MIDLDEARIEVEGCNAAWWPLAGPDQWSKNVALADEDSGTDFDGMYDPPVTALYNSTAFQAGADFGGIREEKYDFILAVHIVGTKEKPWRLVDSEFRKAFSYKRESRIWVELDGSRRHLPVRLGDKPKIKTNNDPNSEKGALILLPLVGAYPRWIENVQPSTFTTLTDTTGGGTETGYVWVDNPLPEDYDQYPIWEITATYEGLTVTLPDYSQGNDIHERAEEDLLRKVVLAPLHLGEHLRVNVDPMAFEGQFVTATRSEYAQRMNGRRLMYPIRAGTLRQQVPVTVTKAPIGTKIRVTCPREWPRPWGLD
ncbi:hypothetical protein [Nocardia wallacei]|uniref:hypothetical protein n=1 Tax=Nocardia wallacei TaxID=480035 RepID=UPI00245660F1|nr:hypothetical protein [Nocardia wallacei]